jgi:hypothetical protein
MIYRALLIAPVVGVACDVPPPPNPRSVAAVAPVVAQPVAASATATVAPASSPSVVAATPGRIPCGSTTCDTTRQICCNAERCIDHAEVEAWMRAHPEKRYGPLGGGCPVAGHWAYQAAACDDADDCPAGQACCEWGRGSESVSTVCAPPPCMQICSAPKGCTPDYRCEMDPDPRGIIKGYCRHTAAKVTCADQTCSGQKHICCNPRQDVIDDGLATGPHCISDAESCVGMRIACRRNTDCGGGRRCCALNLGDTMCMGSCSILLGDRPLCETIADCPATEQLVPKSCSGVCEY